MRVRDLPIAPAVRDHLESEGIDELYPPQAAAVRAGVCEGANVVAAVPTASGKTLIAALALLTADGPGLYVCPLRALAREKHATLAALPGVDAAIATGDYDSAAEELAGHDVVVATSEKVDSAIRNGAAWIDDLACVVVDEIHLVGAPDRGPTLEVTLATLGRRAPDVQVVALSATVGNPGDVAGWLGAELVESRWRPVDLRVGVYAEGRVRFDDGTERAVRPARGGAVGDPGSGSGSGSGSDSPTDPDSDPDSDGGAETALEPADDATAATVALVEEAVAEGGGCLAFVASRAKAEALAERLAAAGVTETAPGDHAAVADAVAAVDGTAAGERLAARARSGVAFHHAGLRRDHRAVVERAFRDRGLACLCATPTLAAGVNVPARRVIVRDLRRYTGGGTEWLPTLEVHQMCGRAGRPGLDPYGEAVLVGDADSRAELQERYVEREPGPVESRLAAPEALRTHVLSAVATGSADSRDEVLELLSGTFFAWQAGVDDLVDGVIAALAELEGLGLLDREGAGADARLRPTPTGAVASRQYVRPETAARILEGLSTAAAMDDPTPLTVLEAVCDTPDMDDGYLAEGERAATYRFARTHAGEFTTSMTETDDFEDWLESVKTARILAAWADGATIEALTDDHRIGPGDLESRIERAAWLVGAAEALADAAGIDLDPLDRLRTAFAGRERAG